MKKNFFILVLMAFFFQGISQPIEVKGVVEGTWSADSIRVVGDLVISEGTTLLIEPGVYIEFAGYYQLTVLGTLKAVGTESDSIRFTVSDTTGFHNFEAETGGWHGIRFYSVTGNQQDNSILNYCNISYAKGVGADSIDKYRGAVYVDNYPPLSIDHSTFYKNFATAQGGAIGLYQSNIMIHDCVLKDNRAGDELVAIGAALSATRSNFTMKNCSMINNKATSVGGAFFLTECNGALVENCTFTGSFGSSGGTIFIADCPNMLLVDNLFYDNESRFFGAALAARNSVVQVINCTITQNHSHQSGGGIYLSNDAILNLFNTIVYGNSAASSGQQIHIAFISSTCNFRNCDIEGGVEAFTGGGGYPAYWGKIDTTTIDKDPLFMDPENNNYRLSNNAPCLEKGSIDSIESWIPEYDLDGNPRIVNQNIDMGCYENQTIIVGTTEMKKNQDVNLFYADGQLYYKAERNIKQILIFDLKGVLVSEYEINNNSGSVALLSPNFGLIIAKIVFDNHQTVATKMFLRK